MPIFGDEGLIVPNETLTSYIRGLSGLVAYYPLDELSGNVANDKSGNGLNGTITGATVGQAGKVGKAYSFDGTGDYVALPQGGGIPFYDNTVFSISMLVYKDTLTSEIFMFAEGSSADNDPAYTVGMVDSAGSNKVRIFIRNDAGGVLVNAVKSTAVVSLAAWHHIVWIDDNGTCKLYIDGVEDDNSVSGNFDYTRGTLTLNKSTIGALIRSAVSNLWIGDMQHVAIFNKALTAGEILKLAKLAGLA